MFNDLDTEIIGFESSSEIERVVNDRSCQTADLNTSTQGTQTTTAQCSANQAAPKVSLKFADSYDADKLLKFLNRIMPHLEDELRSCNSNDLNFGEKDINFSLNNEYQERVEDVGKKTILKPDFCKEKIVACVSWNSSYVLLAVAYSEKDHKGWCCHETSISIYNTGKPLFEKEPPIQSLKVSGCVTCIKFHYEKPSLLAGGLYTGAVVVWDLKNANEVLMFNKKGLEDEAPHVKVITFLTWEKTQNENLLLTAGRDGRIILWKVSLTSKIYEVSDRFLILRKHVAKSAEFSEHLEILSLDVRSSLKDFVVACAGGNIFYCSFSSTTYLTFFPRHKDPVLRCYKRRTGIITCVSCCNEIFASCGTDSEIHIFKYDQETPIMKLVTDYPIVGVNCDSFSTIYGWGGSVVECHYVTHPNNKKVICEIEGSISAVAFGPQGTGLNRKFAIANQTGEVLILRLDSSHRGDEIEN